jgi:hypothetical protein
MNNFAPIVLFTYRRPQTAYKTLIALSKNPLAEQSTLYIYADGPKENSSEEVLLDIKKNRQIIRKKKWCKEVVIIERDKNKGLANSVIEGITEVVNKHGKVIVMDEDMFPATGFLKYLNDALFKYEKEERVMQVSGYILPFADRTTPTHSAYFVPYPGSPAWATWKRAWDKFDPQAIGYEKLKTNDDLALKFDVDGLYPYSDMLISQMESSKVDSWAIRWQWTFFINNGLALSPDKSLTQYLTSGDKATHVRGNDLPFTHDDFDRNYFINHFPAQITVNEEFYNRVKSALKRIITYSPKHTPSFLLRIKIIIRKIMGDFIYNKIKIYALNFK